MREFRFLVLATAATAGALLAPARATAHDLRARVTVTGTEPVKVVVYFEDDVPAEFAEVRVTGASGAVVAEGRTDERGVWTFPCPAPGTYTLSAKSIGHVATLSFPVADVSGGPVEYTGWRMNQSLALASGLTLLLGISALSWFLRRRRSVQS